MHGRPASRQSSPSRATATIAERGGESSPKSLAHPSQPTGVAGLGGRLGAVLRQALLRFGTNCDTELHGLLQQPLVVAVSRALWLHLNLLWFRP